MSDAGSRYRFSWDVTGQSNWIRVSGDDLPMPIEIRFGRAPNGRTTVRGLRIDTDPIRAADPSNIDVEITSATLRRIKLSEIQAAYYESITGFYRDVGVLKGEQSTAGTSRPRRTPGRGPTNDDLRKFADAYKAALDAVPSRAMTTTAKGLKISRATANRWAALCRELGYLPNPSEGETSS